MSDNKTSRQKAKQQFLKLPASVRAQFLSEWSAINNALDMGDKQAAIIRLDGIVVPPELQSSKANIKSFLEE